MGGPLSPRTDVYGLAMTAWTLLTSVPARYASVQPPPGTSPTLLSTIDAALAVDPERRLPSMQAFADGLGGRLPTERGRDIGVSAAVGEGDRAGARGGRQDRRRRVRRRRHLDRAARTDGGLDYQAAWGAGADEVVGMRLGRAPGSPAACSPPASARSSRTAATTRTSPPRPLAGRATCRTR